MPPYFFLPPAHCSASSLKYDLGCLVADGDVDLALGQHEVGDLVVAAARQALLLEVVARVDVVHVAAVHQQVEHRDVARQEALVAELHLRCLVGEEVGADATTRCP